MPPSNLTSRIRVEVYVPIHHKFAYQYVLNWLIDEFTKSRGGCTVNESVAGYYLSHVGKVIDDRVSIVYSDFPFDWNKDSERSDVLQYCAALKHFLLQNLWEEEILITAYPVSHVSV